jgi:hypothetical protein
VGNPCNLQPYTAGIDFSIMYNLAATYAILRWRWLCYPQYVPPLFVIIFLSNSIPLHDPYTQTSTKCKWITIEPNNGHFDSYTIHSHTVNSQTPDRLPQHCQCSHETYDPECTFKNCLQERKQQEQETACNWMWVYPYCGEWLSNNHITYSGCT